MKTLFATVTPAHTAARMTTEQLSVSPIDRLRLERSPRCLERGQPDKPIWSSASSIYTVSSLWPIWFPAASSLSVGCMSRWRIRPPPKKRRQGSLRLPGAAG